MYVLVLTYAVMTPNLLIQYGTSVKVNKHVNFR
jgi:hypothetical protein